MRRIAERSLKDEIRELLSEEALTCQQLAGRLNRTCEEVNIVTAYEMTDTYEEDNGKIKLLGVEYGKQTRTLHRVTPEMVAIIKELAGKMAVCEIAREVQDRLGVWISNFSVQDVIRREKLARYTRKVWTPEMDSFLLEYHKTNTARGRTEVLNKKFGTQFTKRAVSWRLCSLLEQEDIPSKVFLSEK